VNLASGASSVKQTENGEIPFHYTQLSQLKHGIKPDQSSQTGLPEKIKMISLTREYSTDIITLFHATGDPSFRSRWKEGVRSVELLEEINHILPRVGMRSRFIMDNGQVTVYASSYSYHPERIEFSETEEKKGNSTFFLLEKIGADRTKLTLEYYVPKGPLGPTLFRLTKKKKMEESLRRSMLKLGELLKEIPSFAMDTDLWPGVGADLSEN